MNWHVALPGSPSARWRDPAPFTTPNQNRRGVAALVSNLAGQGALAVLDSLADHRPLKLRERGQHGDHCSLTPLPVATGSLASWPRNLHAVAAARLVTASDGGLMPIGLMRNQVT